MLTLKKTKEFKKVYSSGTSYADKYLVLYKRPNNAHITKVGFSISKKVGKAVIRNRLRRQLKQLYRLNEYQISTGYDIIFIARIRAASLPYSQLKSSFIYLMKKHGLIS